MKIRDRLLVGFGFYILIAVVSGFFAYKDLIRISSRLNLVEIAYDMTNNLLEVRRYEKNYLLFRDRESLDAFRKYLGDFKKDIGNIEAPTVLEIGTHDFNGMKNSVEEYEKLFERITVNFGAQQELATLTTTEAKRVEEKLRGTGDLGTFLVLRRLERNLLLYKDRDTYENFMRIYGQMNGRGEAEHYILLTRKLFGLYLDERGMIEQMRVKARAMQTMTESLSRRERKGIEATLRTSMTAVIISLVGVVLLGTIINLKLAKCIATPIKRLETITKKIASGDFSETIAVSGKDEIASLESSFNQMEEKLKVAMTSLERTIGELKEQQERLVEAEKLASIGKLAAGIAHEINNPLTSVLTFSSLMLETMPADDPRCERLKMIVRETTRARNIVRHVLNFAREAPLKAVMMDINRPVGEIIDSLTAQGSFNGIELTTDLSGQLPEISIDPVQIGQVVMNILLNAVHSITPPGKIHVATESSGGQVELVFSDTGSGIPEEHLKKIFDPFFTTKDKTKGTGLGLAVSYGIIKKHGGDIEVKSTVGEGSTFIVRLPVTHA